VSAKDRAKTGVHSRAGALFRGDRIIRSFRKFSRRMEVVFDVWEGMELFLLVGVVMSEGCGDV
jgi:hypothetical protein